MTSTINLTWGDTGDRPNDGEDFQTGDIADPQTFDWLFNTTTTKIDSLISDIDNIENGGTTVDTADYANDADASTYKGNDIDSDGDGIVDQADSADEADNTQTIQGVGLANLVEETELTNHASDPDIHHTKYTDTNARNAVDGSNVSITGTAAYANDADASTYKGNDIDSNGDGIVDSADTAGISDTTKGVEERTTDPTNPGGRIWIRTDL